jgi:hypothetical protein
MLITKAEAARQLGMTKHGVWRAVQTGRLTTIQDAAGNWLIESETMRAELAAKTQHQAPRRSQADLRYEADHAALVAALLERCPFSDTAESFQLRDRVRTKLKDVSREV